MARKSKKKTEVLEEPVLETVEAVVEDVKSEEEEVVETNEVQEEVKEEITETDNEEVKLEEEGQIVNDFDVTEPTEPAGEGEELEESTTVVEEGELSSESEENVELDFSNIFSDEAENDEEVKMTIEEPSEEKVEPVKDVKEKHKPKRIKLGHGFSFSWNGMSYN